MLHLLGVLTGLYLTWEIVLDMIRYCWRNEF